MLSPHPGSVLFFFYYKCILWPVLLSILPVPEKSVTFMDDIMFESLSILGLIYPTAASSEALPLHRRVLISCFESVTDEFTATI